MHTCHIVYWASQVALMVKNLPASEGDIRGAGSIPSREDPLEEGTATTPVFLPGESQGRQSLVACRLWGCTELDMTEAS